MVHWLLQVLPCLFHSIHKSSHRGGGRWGRCSSVTADALIKCSSTFCKSFFGFRFRYVCNYLYISQMTAMKNPIYLFYERVNTAADGTPGKDRDTVEFKSIHQSQVTEGPWHVEIWSLSRVTKGYWRKVRTVTCWQSTKYCNSHSKLGFLPVNH